MFAKSVETVASSICRNDSMTFFRVVDNPAVGDLWFPDEPLSEDGLEIDSREFTQGRPYVGPPPCRVPLAQQGRPTEFTLAAFDMPIISQRVGRMLDDFCHAGIQRFPVAVGPFSSGYEILNVTSTCLCIDEQKSEILRWTDEDRRPDKLGTYRMITNLTIDASRVVGEHIFRVRGWEIALIVSDDVRTAIEGTCDLGVLFEAVSSP